MTALSGSLSDAAALLDRSRNVLLTCHLGPDGDALGSMSALAALLSAQGRLVTLYNPDPVPRSLRFLPRIETIVTKVVGPYDLTVIVDCGDRKLLGPRFLEPETTGPLLVIDHHAAARPFGDLYYCDRSAASVGVLVARLARQLEWSIAPESAVGLYVSLAADTGFFRYANTNAEAMQLAAELVSTYDVEPWTIARALGEEIPLAHYRLLSLALAALALEAGGRIAVLAITPEMLYQAGAKWEHVEGIVSYARSIEGVECGVLLTSGREGGTRVSMRSKGRIDAGAICSTFGGGGHPGAAGCHLPLDLAAARARIVQAIADRLP